VPGTVNTRDTDMPDAKVVLVSRSLHSSQKNQDKQTHRVGNMGTRLAVGSWETYFILNEEM